MSGDHNMHCSANQPGKEMPLALRLAEYFETTPLGSDLDDEMGLKAAAELRRLHAMNEELMEALSLVLSTYNDGGWPTATIIIANAALAKAKEQI